MKVDYQTKKSYMITIVLKYKFWFSKNIGTSFTLDLSVTKKVIVRNFMEFV